MAAATVDAYIAALPEERRGGIESIRAAVRAAAPEAEEVITYAMPGLKTHGRFLVSYAAFARHYSLFPATDGVIAELGAAIEPHLTGRGTIRFAADQPIPSELIRRIVAVRLRENELAYRAAREAAAARRRRSKGG